MENNLRNDLKRLMEKVDAASEEELDQLSNIKAQLVQLQKKKSEATAIRARVDTYLYEERYSAFFLGLEKKKQEKQMINELIDENGKIVKGKEGIEEVAVNFYQNMFQRDEISKLEGEKIVK